jgi:hypothetical protein
MPGLISKVSSDQMRQKWTLNHSLQPLGTQYHASYAFYLPALAAKPVHPIRHGAVKWHDCQAGKLGN